MNVRSVYVCVRACVCVVRVCERACVRICLCMTLIYNLICCVSVCIYDVQPCVDFANSATHDSQNYVWFHPKSLLSTFLPEHNFYKHR